MSFLKIKDPSKREKLVAEKIKTKNKIQSNFRSERLGEQSMYEDFGKIFKPITEQQQKSPEEIVSKFAPLQEAIENMPAQQALPWDMPQPELEGQAEVLPAPDDGLMNVGPIACKYFTKSTKKKQWDETFGPKGDNKENLKLGDAEFKTDGKEMIINGKRYKGTEGLWELVTMHIPDKNVYSDDDKEKYKEIMVSTNAMRNPKTPDSPAGNSKGYKWENHIRPIWVEYVKKQSKLQRKQNANRKKHKVKAFSQVTQTLCVNGWNC